MICIIGPLTYLILIGIAGSGIVIGLILFLKPASAIEFQKKFYEKINWRIEPISMPKEIRNTRIMGLFLIVISALSMILIFGIPCCLYH